MHEDSLPYKQRQVLQADYRYWNKRNVVAYSKLCCGMNHRVAYLLDPMKTKTKTKLRDTNNITNGVT